MSTVIVSAVSAHPMYYNGQSLYLLSLLLLTNTTFKNSNDRFLTKSSLNYHLQIYLILPTIYFNSIKFYQSEILHFSFIKFIRQINRNLLDELQNRLVVFMVLIKTFTLL